MNTTAQVVEFTVPRFTVDRALHERHKPQASKYSSQHLPRRTVPLQKPRKTTIFALEGRALLRPPGVLQETPKTLVALLCLGLVSVTIGWSDVGPDILTPLANGDREAMLRIEDRASLAAQEGNRVAQVIAHEAKIALGQDRSINRFMVNHTPPKGLYEDTEKDWLVAVEKKAADGDPFFMDVMGFLCLKGYAGVMKDQQKAVTWWKKGSELNGGLAKLRLGMCYVNREVFPRDLQKAAVFYREAGELGIPDGWYELGCLYNGGEGWSPRDLKKAMECWTKAASMDHATAQFTLGTFYCNGNDGFPKNKKLGIQWMKAAVSNGHPDAQSYLTDFVDNKPLPRTLPAVIEDKSTDVVSTIIAFDKIKESIAGPKVSIVCFVDSYEPQIPKPAVLPNRTPSHMLDIYLSGLRTLNRRPAESAGANTVNPENVKIFIVECWQDTRAQVREFNKQYPRNAYDGSIPVLYVFHSGRWVKTYTYLQNPGPKGEALRSLVESLLTKK